MITSDSYNEIENQIRDKFANTALAEILKRHDYIEDKDIYIIISKQAYEIAEMMMATRNGEFPAA